MSARCERPKPVTHQIGQLSTPHVIIMSYLPRMAPHHHELHPPITLLCIYREHMI
jgi:hypothetical protein